ncbi:hypothetical protein EBT31_22940, partial [bacterium]|nr:hypothetical protein [bacterium]
GMTIDDISPPGSWQREIELQPWKYKQEQKVGWALSEMRLRGMFKEADILAQEISVLKAELERLRGHRE